MPKIRSELYKDTKYDRKLGELSFKTCPFPTVPPTHFPYKCKQGTHAYLMGDKTSPKRRRFMYLLNRKRLVFDRVAASGAECNHIPPRGSLRMAVEQLSKLNQPENSFPYPFLPLQSSHRRERKRETLRV